MVLTIESNIEDLKIGESIRAKFTVDSALIELMPNQMIF